MLLTPENVRVLQNSFDARYQTGYKRTSTFWQDIAFRTETDALVTVFGWMDRFPSMRQWVGDRQFNNAAIRSTQVTVKDWEDSVEIDRNDILDDRLGVLAPTIEMLGIEAKQYPDKLAAATIRNGVNAPSWDQTTFFSTAHPISIDQPAYGTQSNNFTGMPLSPNSYQAGLASVTSFLGADGNPLGTFNSPEGRILLVPPQLEYMAKTIINGDLNAVPVNSAGGFGGGSIVGAAAQSNVLRNTAKVISTPWLAADPTTWYLIDASLPIRPFVFVDRQAPQMVQLISPTDQNVFKNKKFWYGWDARGATDYGLWFLAARFTA